MHTIEKIDDIGKNPAGIRADGRPVNVKHPVVKTIKAGHEKVDFSYGGIGKFYCASHRQAAIRA